jgi:hypothetical protein
MAKLQYWRADNMWAAEGRPDGNLGMEEATVQSGQKRVFITDWRYEKVRNDGTNYYGSHGRKLKNPGPGNVVVVLTVSPGQLHQPRQTLTPGQEMNIKADIIEVSAP